MHSELHARQVLALVGLLAMLSIAIVLPDHPIVSDWRAELQQELTGQIQGTSVVTPPVASDAAGLVPVLDVVDGDTLRVLYQGEPTKVRLVGVDAPETVHPQREDECYGLEASLRLKELAQGKQVRLVVDQQQDDTDRYDRLLRYVESEAGMDLGAELLRGGYVRVYESLPADRVVTYQELMREAQRSQQGLWQACQ